MSDELKYVHITAGEGGAIRMEIPEGDGDRNMSDSEIALLAFYTRTHKDPEWASDLINWFETTYGDQLDTVEVEEI